MAWGRINKSETSALAYVLHARAAGGFHDLGELTRRVAALTDDEMRAGLRELAGRAGGTIEVMDAPEGRVKPYMPPARRSRASIRSASGGVLSGTGEYRASRRSPRVRRSWWSFPTGTLEMAEKQFGIEGLERTIGPEQGTGRTIFDFPRGTRAGSCLHDVFEHLDFRNGIRPTEGKRWRRAFCAGVRR